MRDIKQDLQIYVGNDGLYYGFDYVNVPHEPSPFYRVYRHVVPESHVTHIEDKFLGIRRQLQHAIDLAFTDFEEVKHELE